MSISRDRHSLGILFVIIPTPHHRRGRPDLALDVTAEYAHLPLRAVMAANGALSALSVQGVSPPLALALVPSAHRPVYVAAPASG